MCRQALDSIDKLIDEWLFRGAEEQQTMRAIYRVIKLARGESAACPDCAIRWSCSLEADGPEFEPCPDCAKKAETEHQACRVCSL